MLSTCSNSSVHEPHANARMAGAQTLGDNVLGALLELARSARRLNHLP